jgi:acyl-CoA synthetase (AMP-forming)/AMP-acid ligase II
VTTIASILRVPDPAVPALVAPGLAPRSFGELDELVDGLAGQLAALVPSGARVASLLPNGPAAAALFLATVRVGSAAPLNPRLQPAEVAAACADLGAALLVLPPGTAAPPGGPRPAWLRDTPAGWDLTDGNGGSLPVATVPGRAPGDEALVLQTSGTTARPKTVPLTHANILASAANIARTLQLTPDDRSLAVMPLFHIHGTVASLLSPLVAGGSVALPAGGFDAFRFASWLGELQPTWYSAVPTMHQLILGRASRDASALRTSRLRFVRSSSASLPPTVLAGLEAAFAAPAIEAYGMTEAAHQVTSNPLPPGERRPGSVGFGVGVDVAILDSEGNTLPAGAVGEVGIRGPNVMAGYFENPTANAAAFAGSWFRTGDQGSLDDDGYLVLTGRIKELINRGGEKVAPREVEEVLLQHPAVREAACFPVPHGTLGEDVAAAVVLDGPVSDRELRAFAASRLADFKIPRTVAFVDALPVGPTGKVQRLLLASQLGLAPEGN